MSKNHVHEVAEDTYTFELPHGVKDAEGNLHKEIEIIEMNGKVDEQIAKPDVRVNTGKIINAVLSVCLKRVGELTPQKLGKAKWDKMISDMFMGDRDYVMMKLREVTYGDELEIDLQCPSCRDKFRYIVELLTDVEYKPVLGDPEAIPFELPRGIKNKEGVLVTEGKLALPTGFDQEQMDNMLRRNPGQANTTLLTRALKELGDVTINSDTVRNLNKRDREYLVEHLTENMFGPKLVIEVECPSCSDKFDTGINPVNFL